jgi:signal transduction histidine kinase
MPSHCFLRSGDLVSSPSPFQPFAALSSHADCTPAPDGWLDSRAAAAQASSSTSHLLLSGAALSVDVACTITLLLLATQLLLTRRISLSLPAAASLLSHRVWQFLGGWIALHLCAQQCLRLVDATLLTFINQVCLLTAALVILCSERIATRLRSRFPSLIRSNSAVVETLTSNFDLTHRPANVVLPPMNTAIPRSMSRSDTHHPLPVHVAPLSSAGVRSIVVPWEHGMTPPSQSAPSVCAMGQSPTGTNLEQDLADFEREQKTEFHSEQIVLSELSSPILTGFEHSGLELLNPSAIKSDNVVSIPSTNTNTLDLPIPEAEVLTASDGTSIILNHSPSRALVVAPGVPVAAASSSLSHSKNMLKLAKAKLSKLEGDFSRSIEESSQKASFFSVLCHELRNPLQVITANTDFLLEDSHSGDAGAQSLTPDQRDLITSVNSSAELMLAIVNDVLDMSRLQSGRMTFERLPIDLHFLCHSILNISRSQAANKQIRLELHIDEEVPRFVVSDPTRIHQLLLNLISNAVKFTDKDGSVTLTLRTTNHQHKLQHINGDERTQTTRPAQVGSVEDASGESPWPNRSPARSHSPAASESPSEDDTPAEMVTIMFSVADSGLGIAPENLDKLFKPYSQATVSTMRTFGGTGSVEVIQLGDRSWSGDAFCC